MVWMIVRIPLAPILFLVALSGACEGGWSQVLEDFSYLWNLDEGE